MRGLPALLGACRRFLHTSGPGPWVEGQGSMNCRVWGLGSVTFRAQGQGGVAFYILRDLCGHGGGGKSLVQ